MILPLAIILAFCVALAMVPDWPDRSAMTFRSALAAIERIYSGKPRYEDVERVREFVERVERLANAAKHAYSPDSAIGRGLRDVSRGSR